MVVEETLTKNGKDFYDQFYHYYSYNKIKGDEIVIIDEMFTFRTRTKINVKIGDEEIFSFFGVQMMSISMKWQRFRFKKFTNILKIKRKKKRILRAIKTIIFY